MSEVGMSAYDMIVKSTWEIAIADVLRAGYSRYYVPNRFAAQCIVGQSVEDKLYYVIATYTKERVAGPFETKEALALGYLMIVGQE